MSGTVLDLLRVGRAQTAAVEAAGFPLAAWIGGAPMWTLPLFALLGLLSHLGGFGENGLSDLAFDRTDPSKAHHPLVSGRMRFRTALAFVYGCQGAGLILLGVLLALNGWRDWGLPAAAFLGYILLGHAYNFVGKEWKPGAVLEISGAFALAFLACATAWGSGVTPLIGLVAAYAFAFTAFQIAVAGEMKEIGQSGESNLLRRLGSRVSDGVLHTGRSASELAGFLTLSKMILLWAIAVLIGGPFFGFMVWVVSMVALVAYTILLVGNGAFDRPRRMRLMGLGEAGSYLLLVLALAPMLLPWLLPLFILLPVLWFGGLNRLLWSTGSAWAPGV